MRHTNHFSFKSITTYASIIVFCILCLTTSNYAFAVVPSNPAVRPTTAAVPYLGECHEEISTQDSCKLIIPNGWSLRIETDYVTTTQNNVISYDFSRLKKVFDDYHGGTYLTQSYPNNRWVGTGWVDGNAADSTDPAKSIYITPIDGNLCKILNNDAICEDEVEGYPLIDWDKETSRFYAVFRTNSTACRDASRSGFPTAFSGQHQTVGSCEQEQRIYYVLDNGDTRLSDGLSFLTATNPFHRDVDDKTAPIVTVSGPANTDPASQKTVSATDDDSTSTTWVYKQIANAQSKTSCVAADFSTSPTTYTEGQTITLSAEADNNSKICFRSTDGAGNIGYGISGLINGIDRTAPIVTVSGPANTDPASQKTVSATDSDAGTTTWVYKQIANAQSKTSCVAGDFNSPTTYTEGSTITLRATTDNNSKICFRSTDQVGNVGYGISSLINGIGSAVQIQKSAVKESVKPLAKPVITLSGYSGSARVTVSSPVDLDAARNSADGNGGEPVDGEIVYVYSSEYASDSDCATVYGAEQGKKTYSDWFKATSFNVAKFPLCSSAKISVIAHTIYADGTDENNQTVWRLRKGSESPESNVVTPSFAPKVTNVAASFVNQSDAQGGITYSFSGITTNDSQRFSVLYRIETRYDHNDTWSTLHETETTSGTIPGDDVLNTLLSLATWGHSKDVGTFQLRVEASLYEDAAYTIFSESTVSDAVTLSLSPRLSAPTNFNLTGSLDDNTLQYSFTPVQNWILPKHWYRLEVLTPGQNGNASTWESAFREIYSFETTGSLDAQALTIPSIASLQFRLKAVSYTPWGSDIIESSNSNVVTITGRSKESVDPVVVASQTTQDADQQAIALLRDLVLELGKMVSKIEKQIQSLTQ
ncbi:MAG: hypothetical protein OYG31_00775 [Candidatus Kaiserbacteria bacterium]|nr:hypothetical protein [Candidatus Kaiserbacteria bacterium]